MFLKTIPNFIKIFNVTFPSLRWAKQNTPILIYTEALITPPFPTPHFRLLAYLRALLCELVSIGDFYYHFYCFVGT